MKGFFMDIKIGATALAGVVFVGFVCRDETCRPPAGYRASDRVVGNWSAKRPVDILRPAL